MRDEIDGRMWIAHHKEFSNWVEGALAALRSGLDRIAGRFGEWDGSLSHLGALVAAFAAAALTVKGTAL